MAPIWWWSLITRSLPPRAETERPLLPNGSNGFRSTLNTLAVLTANHGFKGTHHRTKAAGHILRDGGNNKHFFAVTHPSFSGHCSWVLVLGAVRSGFISCRLCCLHAVRLESLQGSYCHVVILLCCIMCQIMLGVDLAVVEMVLLASRSSLHALLQGLVGWTDLKAQLMWLLWLQLFPFAKAELEWGISGVMSSFH